MQLIVSGNVSVERGQTAVLECRVIADAKLHYSVRWWRNGSVVHSMQEAGYQLSVNPPVYNLTILKVNESHAGSYRCVARSVYREEEASGTVELRLSEYSNIIIRLCCGVDCYIHIACKYCFCHI